MKKDTKTNSKTDSGDKAKTGSKIKKIFHRITIALFVTCAVIALCEGALVFYASDYCHAGDTAEQIVNGSSENVMIVNSPNNEIIFVPEEQPKVGLIFYPGGKVQYEAYAPLLESLAEHGVLCILLHMPYNLAVLDANAADGIEAMWPDVEQWYIGGHSLGGVMAASYAAKHTEEFDGLILLAAYSTKDLSDSGLKVLSMYGSEDGVLNLEEYENSRDNLPADTTEIVIEGGCHAQFGDYGEQEGDGTPTISREEQTEQTVDAILELVGISEE